jgi:hypothetical protein
MDRYPGDRQQGAVGKAASYFYSNMYYFDDALFRGRCLML